MWHTVVSETDIIKRWNWLTEKGCGFIDFILAVLSFESSLSEDTTLCKQLISGENSESGYYQPYICKDTCPPFFGPHIILGQGGLAVFMTQQMFLSIYFIKACSEPLWSLLPLVIIFTGRRCWGSCSFLGFVMRVKSPFLRVERGDFVYPWVNSVPL